MLRCLTKPRLDLIANSRHQPELHKSGVMLKHYFHTDLKAIHTVKSCKWIPWWWVPHVLIKHAWLNVHSDCWSLKRNCSEAKLFMPLNILGVQSSVVRTVILTQGERKMYPFDTYSNISCQWAGKLLQSHLLQTPLRFKWTHPVEWSPGSD